MKKTREEFCIDEDDRVKALADFLELSEDEYDVISPSRYGENLFKYGKREYYVLTDDEADDMHKEMQEQLLGDMGMDSFTPSFQDWIMKNAIDTDKFWEGYYNDIANPIESNPDEEESLFNEDEIKDFLKAYVENDKKNNKKLDGYSDDFIEEIDNASLSDCLKVVDALGEIDRFIEGAVETFIGFFDSPANFLQEMGYKARDLFEALEPYLDIDMIVEEIKDSDGRGSTIARYDGDENEVNIDRETFYIYRSN